MLRFTTAIISCLIAVNVSAQNCQGLPSKSQLQDRLVASSSGTIGGLFFGSRMWAAIVNRAGDVCVFVTSTEDPTDVWPGSQAIAKAKAYTANAFSLDILPLSTARLFTFTQPGHSLWSLGQSNLFDSDSLGTFSGDSGTRRTEGGLIFFGGGVPIYSSEGEIIGGLGVSGDTSCADHEIAKTLRDLLGLNPPGGKLVDDISYSLADGPTFFTHPLCINTWRNGVLIGHEAPASGY